MNTHAAATDRLTRSDPHDYHAIPGDRYYRLAILLGLGLVILASWQLQVFHGVIHVAREHGWASLIVRPAMLWAGMGMLMLLFRTLLWFRYRTPRSTGPGDAPLLTVIIPPTTRGRWWRVRSTRSRRPATRATGWKSSSSTMAAPMTPGCTSSRLAVQYPDLVSTLCFARNQGKRAALEAGFRRARGEVLVTIDSDSVIEPGTLMAMAGPFRDPRIGAVAGKVSVYNLAQGLIPRMLKVRYAL